jgi:hypothetical protein
MVTGCGGEDASVITAEWSLVSGDQNTPTDCPPGATTIAMHSLDELDNEIVDLFDCGDFIGTSGDMVPGAYYTWLRLEGEGGELYAQSRGTDVTVVDGGESILSFEFSVDRGEYQVEWEIWDGAVATDCATVGATEFALDYTDANGDLFGPDTFACDAYSGVTPGIALGAWSISPSIIDDSQLAIAVGASIDTVMEYGNQLYDLGLVSLDLQAVF